MLDIILTKITIYIIKVWDLILPPKFSNFGFIKFHPFELR